MYIVKIERLNQISDTYVSETVEIEASNYELESGFFNFYINAILPGTTEDIIMVATYPESDVISIKMINPLVKNSEKIEKYISDELDTEWDYVNGLHTKIEIINELLHLVDEDGNIEFSKEYLIKNILKL